MEEQKENEFTRKTDSSEQVLIERDGKFELVNVADMQAKDGNVSVQDKLRSNGTPDSSSLAEREQPQDEVSAIVLLSKKEQDGATSEQASGGIEGATDEEAYLKTSGIKEKKESQEVDTNDSNTSSRISKESEASSKKPSPPSTENETGNHVSISEAEHIRHTDFSTGASPKQARPNQDRVDMSVTTSTTAFHQQRKIKRISPGGRTKSAPGLRLQTRDQEDEERERRERNEAAFIVWRTKKDREIAEKKKQEMMTHKYDAEQLEEKRSRNEAAFQAWLTFKNEKFHEEQNRDKLSRPATSVPKESEERNRTAFKMWLNRKQDERQCEIQLKQRQHQEEEEVAKTADPTTVEQAYKRWLHGKNVQAREETLKKELYRKHYFSQTRRSKHALARFEGF